MKFSKLEMSLLNTIEKIIVRGFKWAKMTFAYTHDVNHLLINPTTIGTADAWIANSLTE